jgi:hypothetical protein
MMLYSATVNIRTRFLSFDRMIFVGVLVLICADVQAQCLFVSDNQSGNIYKFTPSGAQSTFASGLAGPAGLAFNSAGNLFVADPVSGTVYQFTPDGTRSTFASGLLEPTALAFDKAGDLFVADGYGNNIIEFTPDGTQSIFASGLNNPYGVAFNSTGDLFVASAGGNNIIEITPSGVQSTFVTGLNDPVALTFEPVPQLQAIGTNGVFQLNVSMPSPYYSTIIQASTDLVNWANLYTNTPPFTFTDSMATNFPCRYYRALLGP